MSSTVLDRRLEMLSRQVDFCPDGEVLHDELYSLAVPETSGIYVFFDWRGPLYVGKAENLRRRFFNHFNSHNPYLSAALNSPVGKVRFLWLNVDLVDLNKVEARLIEELCPICNIRLNGCRETRMRGRN